MEVWISGNDPLQNFTHGRIVDTDLVPDADHRLDERTGRPVIGNSGGIGILI